MQGSFIAVVLIGGPNYHWQEWIRVGARLERPPDGGGHDESRSAARG